ncbi:MAG: anthranilate synthase component I, partial [Kiritimatiellae bacterium]|nr:anthranilate synthase component I [Kiritimatiellia bacterium]
MLKMLTREQYAQRAAGAGRVAVFREYLADRETPVAALSRLGPDEEGFLLESVAGGESRGRHSFLGIEPRARIEGPDALERVRALLADARYAPAPELPAFQGGAVGYVA